jgi:hypothetical protein
MDLGSIALYPEENGCSHYEYCIVSYIYNSMVPDTAAIRLQRPAQRIPAMGDVPTPNHVIQARVIY